LTTLNSSSELSTDIVIYNRTHTSINHKSITITITIAITITILKLEKLVYPHFNTQTLELYKRIETVIAAIPPDYWVRLKKNKLFTDPKTAYIRICDWGFTQGIYLIKESTNSRKGRWQINCSRYYKETRNLRKTPLKE
jgi:hypothetical protein